ncbi:tyrosyl-DNA phosphodiesterase 1-like isoform X2 [Xenia sp. Carnegie-2017]|uniref:tyrosyl-DNA phosphodiesterase 1-like isoform X2 n=1 Tax=Xenia sp. Carnegie-2017 TaxID=2897299 RepID=UPI001F036E74|nr:tyrosyl-DNA phosphodiesterase 1-like isoform X2 [Xenia sp. Carnegie-2017]
MLSKESHSFGIVFTFLSEHLQEHKRMKLDSTVERPMQDMFDSTNTNIVSYFLTKVSSIPHKYNSPSIAIGLKDILSTKMGDLKASVQFNFMFDIPWLMENYPPDKRSKPLLIVHGHQHEMKQQLMLQAEPYPNVALCQAKLPIAFGTHHSKMMLLLYTEGIRVVIMTANLIPGDWHQKTQGVWISPLFPKILEENATNMSEFQKDLLDYLHHYDVAPLKDWKSQLAKHDMSKARVRLVASVPGRHTGVHKDKWGHLKLRKLLQENGDFDDIQSWPVIGQFSSIGSLGKDTSSWLCGEWMESLTTTIKSKRLSSSSTLHLIFPTVENVRTSLEGYNAGGSLCYSWKTATKQPYLKDFFRCWKSDDVGRTRASPHIKSYSRVSTHNDKAAWFMLTSANLSKAAWGGLEKNKSQLMIRSYEIGVVFFPCDYELSQKYFHLCKDKSNTNGICLRLPYDLPLLPYSHEDECWLWDRHYHKPDVNGRLWKP